jgi:hypothetical protein
MPSCLVDTLRQGRKISEVLIPEDNPPSFYLNISTKLSTVDGQFLILHIAK